MERPLVPDNENEQAPAGANPSNNGGSESNFANQQEYAQDLEKSFLADLDSQIELENQIIEEAAKAPSDNFRKSLLELRKSGEEFLKNISATTVRMFNSNKLVVKLRDSYIDKRSSKIYQELSVSNRLAQPEDYDSFIRMLKSDFWGTSTNAEYTISRADRALEAIGNRFPDKSDDILEVWPELFNKSTDNQRFYGFDAYTENQRRPFVLAQDKEERLEFIKNSHDLIALKCLASYSLDDQEFEVKTETIKRLDSIINKHSRLEHLPQDMATRLLRFAGEYPDQILGDSRRVNFIFKLWKSELKNTYNKNISSFLMPIIADRLRVCSPEETKEIIGLLPRISSISDDFNWVLNILPIDKSHFKPLNAAPKNEITELNKVRAKGQELADGKLYSMLLEGSKKLTKDQEIVFISNLIVNYPNEKQGIGETELAAILDSLININSDRFNINILRSLTELMNRHSWPASLRERIFSANDLNGSSLNKILSGAEPEKYGWTEAEPLLLDKLQLSFHKRAASNDLRHHFYEVLDNKKKSSDLDDLIKAYGDSEPVFDFEEIRSLFLDNKIDRKYIPYFINKVHSYVIINGIEGNDISTPDAIWLLESSVKYGPAGGGMKALNRLNAMGMLDNPEERLALIDSLADNILLKCDINSDQGKVGNRHNVQANTEEIIRIANMVFNDSPDKFLNPVETNYLGKKIMNGALDFSRFSHASILVLSNPERIKDIFPEDRERQDYLIKIFDKSISRIDRDSNRLVIKAFFSNPELIKTLDDNTRLNLEDEMFNFAFSANERHLLLELLGDMDERQQEKFISRFEKENYRNNNEEGALCYALANKNNFLKYPEIYKRAYLRLLKEPSLSSNSASTLFNKEIVLSDNDLRDAFFANLIRWPEINGAHILRSMAESKNSGGPSLSTEEVKRISATVMQNRGLSPEFWQGYKASDKAKPDFYLDSEIFRIGLNNIDNDFLRKSGNEILSFINSLSADLEAGNFGFNAEDAQTILKKSFTSFSNVERLELFYQYDPNLMENMLSDSLSKHYGKMLDANVNYSASLNNQLLDYTFSQQFSRSTADKIFGRIKKYNDSSMLMAAKEKLSAMNTENKVIGRLSLLKYDFLSVEESRGLYKEATSSSTDNVRAQILNSINIISSMLSNSSNINQLEKFLDNPRPENVKDLQNISEFIGKYSQESKGRSIAVMLFAREYLPDRDLSEVVSKVAHNLKKYEEVINRNSYKYIPKGYHASIGAEYEITSSTAKGYEELTSQPSLKADIALLSEAARIGSGSDAVHEIATRPTDNPYLMLLEMTLLHDIEYIDLNFDRSENYQKGARGFHLTIGGEKGLIVDRETNFLQNALIAASWGGVQSGETGHRVNGGRGVSLRTREGASTHNVPFFGQATNSVELRSLTIDKQETLQRAVTTAFNGAIAIQAFKDCFPGGSFQALELLETKDGEEKLQTELGSKGEAVGKIASLWINLVHKVNEATKKHNQSFLDDETLGYLNDEEVWVDAADFGGQYNRERFQSIVKNIDPTLSLEEYVKTTNINTDDFFRSFSLELSDKLIKINNLYLKPGVSASDNGEKKTNVFKGDQANSLSMLKVTKLDNNTLEDYDDYFLKNTVFDTAGEKRKGYYCLQGGSERMLTHAVQKALLNFNEEMEKILN